MTMTRGLQEHWKRTGWQAGDFQHPVKCRRCRWVFPGEYLVTADVVGGLCAACRSEALAKGGGAMTLRDALMKSDHEMAIRTLPGGETVVGYMSGVGIVLGPPSESMRTESREATQEELDAPAEWAPV